MPLLDTVLTVFGAIIRAAKSTAWVLGADPLVLDLDGDGIETTGIDDARVYFDIDGDRFAERTGWLKGDDGFLVVDANGNGRIDNITEMFGGRFGSGLADLAVYDSNGDGQITATDTRWAELKVWQDYNQNGVTDAGELKGLGATGITALGLTRTAIDVTTPQNAHLLGYGSVSHADGSTTRMFDAVFNSSDVETVYAGEAGTAPWQSGAPINIRGMGSITDLAVAIANDADFYDIVRTTATTMATPDLMTLTGQVGAILGAWGETLELTRELTPVVISADGKTLIDRAVWVEDATGGYFTLKSGGSVHEADGSVLARPSLDQVMHASVPTGSGAGAHWQLEQTWSPSTRAVPLTQRAAAPYLMRVVAGRAVVLDYGVQQADGSWRLASGRSVVSNNGAPIANPTVGDIMAQTHATGTEWRTEELGYNPFAESAHCCDRRSLHRRTSGRLHGSGERPRRWLLRLGTQS